MNGSPSPHARGRLRHHLLGEGGVWLLTIAVALAAAGVLAAGVRGLDPPDAPLRLPWWALAALFLATELHVVHLKFRRDWHTVSLSEAALVAGLFLASPVDLVAGHLLGAAVALIAIRRQPLVKAAFNLSQFALCTGLAVGSFHLVARAGDPDGPAGWAGALTGVVVADLVALVLVVAAMSLMRGELAHEGLRIVLLFGLMASLATTSLTLLVVTILDARPDALPLVLGPLVVVVLAYRATAADRQRQERLDDLHASIGELREADAAGSRVGALLEEARSIFRAEIAEVTLLHDLHDDHASGFRTSRGPGGEAAEDMAVMLTPEERDCIAALAGRRSLLLAARRRPGPAGGVLGSRGFREAIVAGLREQDRLVAFVVVADRAPDAGPLTADDALLLEALAAQLHVSLQISRLERALHEQTALRGKLDHDASHDALTQLPNRALLLRRLDGALARARVGQPGPAVLFLDLDDFKTINDGLGHAAGDAVLVMAAARLSASLRPLDTLARLGGDEFVVVLDQVDDREDALRAAERIAAALEAPFVLDGDEVRVATSIGIRLCDDAPADAAELLRDADVAMYRAKEEGKGAACLWAPHMQAEVVERHRLKADLQGAVQRGELLPHFQPLVDLHTGRVAALETLVRWQHPERGLLGAGAFVEMAEESAIIEEIGRSVLHAACHQVRAWQRAVPGYAELRVTVNLSTRQLRDPAFVGEVRDVLATSGLAPHHLVLEVTESAAMVDFDATVDRLRELHALGVSIAVDDFGTGYSSLSYLQRLPLDMLKIAKPFVDDLGAGPTGNAFAATVVKLGQALDVEIVAEGIENGEQAAALARLGCHLGQGFHFARPLPAAELEALLRGTAADAALPDAA